MSSILAVQGLREHTDEAFRRDMVAVAAELGVEVDYLASAIAFETAGSWSPGAYPNGAVGLIQFTSVALPVVGKTKAELAAMSASAQLRGPVKDYLRKVAAGRPLATLSDLYMAIFAPVGIGRGPDFVLYSEEEDKRREAHGLGPQYAPNRGLDRDNKGFITVADASSAVQAVYDRARGERVLVTAASVGAIAIAAVVAVIALLARKVLP